MIIKKNITNQKFNMLTAISFDHVNNSGKHFWLFKCDCGKEIIKRRDQVLNGKFKTCGEHDRGSRHIEILGQKFGKLTAIKRIQNNKTNHQQYLFRCDCGNEKVISKIIATSGQVICCGCRITENAKILNYKRNLDPNKSALNKLIYQYKICAKRRNIEFNISDEDFINLTKLNCNYCGTPPSQIKKLIKSEYIYTGVDRVDSAKSYDLNNCVPCCGICNRMKMAYPLDIFLKQIELIYNNCVRNKNV
jgi:5-methylcytosine-specific restriction endonuclease McrA